MPLDIFTNLHPLGIVATFALLALIWGLQAALGANLGHRRGLEWQTAFFLGLLFSGLLFAVFYSIRPLSRTEPISAPAWLRTVGYYPALALGGVAVLLTLVLEVIMMGPPAVFLHAPLDFIYGLASIAAILSIPVFASLGGFLGKSWYDIPASQSRPTAVSEYW